MYLWLRYYYSISHGLFIQTEYVVVAWQNKGDVLPCALAEPVSSLIAAGGGSAAALCLPCSGLPPLPHVGSGASFQFSSLHL